MDKVGNLLLKSLSKRGLAGTAISAEICYFADEWGKSRFKSISFSRGVLKVSVRSSAAAQELSMDEEKLIKHLNKKIGREIVKRVRIMNTN